MFFLKAHLKAASDRYPTASPISATDGRFDSNFVSAVVMLFSVSRLLAEQPNELSDCLMNVAHDPDVLRDGGLVGLPYP